MAGSRLPEKRDWDLVPQASCAGCQPRCWEPSLQWFSVGGAPRPTATALGSWAAQSPGPQAGQGSLGAVRRWGGGAVEEEDPAPATSFRGEFRPPSRRQQPLRRLRPQHSQRLERQEGAD